MSARNPIIEPPFAMPTPDLILLTEDRYERPESVDWYVGNILQEDRLVSTALEKQGLSSERVSWSRADFDWSSPRAIVFRSTWDYFDRFAGFLCWLDSLPANVQILNPASQIRWNADKHYLADLADRGVGIPPTRFVERGASTSLSIVLEETGWNEIVLKPAVSGAARHTYRFPASEAGNYESIFQQLLGSESWMLQPFQQSVVEQGEISLIVIGGRQTHAVRKIAREGDFRVQDDHGGKVLAHTATADEIAFAERAVAACEPLPVYARVDLIRDNSGELAVMELELIEPELFFRFHPAAAERFAEEIVRRL